MKTTAFGVAAMGIVMFVFIALLQLVTFDTRAVNLQDGLHSAMENSLSTALDQRAYAVGDEDELVADVVQGIVLELNDPRAELDVTVNAVDSTLGLLSMTLTAHYPSVTTGDARDGTTVSVDRTVILEHVNNKAAAGTQVVVFESGAGDVVKRYSLTAGSQQLPYPTYSPGGDKTFVGWVLGETKYPNNVEGRAALQGLPLNRDYTFVAEESAPLGALTVVANGPVPLHERHVLSDHFTITDVSGAVWSSEAQAFMLDGEIVSGEVQTMAIGYQGAPPLWSTEMSTDMEFVMTEAFIYFTDVDEIRFVELATYEVVLRIVDSTGTENTVTVLLVAEDTR
jgi:hypothetical protein